MDPDLVWTLRKINDSYREWSNDLSVTQPLYRLTNLDSLYWTYLDQNNIHLDIVNLYDQLYRGADKSLARPWKETSYSDQDLQHYDKTYGVKKKQKYIAVVCTTYVLV